MVEKGHDHTVAAVDSGGGERKGDSVSSSGRIAITQKKSAKICIRNNPGCSKICPIFKEYYFGHMQPAHIRYLLGSPFVNIGPVFTCFLKL